MIRDFRIEIVEAQKGRTDLLKWKLILVAALGTLGLGINGFSKDAKPALSLDLALCLVPLVCVYVDLLCKHLQMRILVIGNFFQNHKKDKKDKKDKTLSSEELCIREYENFCQDVRSAFDLEDWAQEWSTVFLSILIGMAAILLEMPEMDSLVLLLSGCLGIILTILIWFLYGRKQKEVQEKAKNLGKKNVCAE